MFLPYDVLWNFLNFLLISYDNTMNDVYEVVQDIREVKCAMLLLGVLPDHDNILDVEVWIFLVDWIKILMSYVDDSIGVCRVTCSILSWPMFYLNDIVHVIGWWYVCLVLVDRCPSTWYMKCEYDSWLSRLKHLCHQCVCMIEIWSWT